MYCWYTALKATGGLTLWMFHLPPYSSNTNCLSFIRTMLKCLPSRLYTAILRHAKEWKCLGLQMPGKLYEISKFGLDDVIWQ